MTSVAENPPDGAARVPLRARDGNVRAYAIIDATDAEWANQWPWSMCNGYASRKIAVQEPHLRQRQIYLHREILGLPRVSDGRQGDHIDRDTLNCRRSNLRIIPPGANQQNVPSNQNSSSQYRGVSRHKNGKRWRAEVQVKGKLVFREYFDNEQAASEAAKTARLREASYAID